MTYILIGVLFMFFVEFLSNKILHNHLNIEIGWVERIIGISLWPILLCIFLYNFLKEFFK